MAKRAWTVTVSWTSTGRDLDIYTTVSSGGQTTSGVGWNNGSQTSMIEVHSGGVNGKFYAVWGGDNTGWGGAETVTVYFDGTLPDGHVGIADVAVHANYYGEGSGTATVTVNNQTGQYSVNPNTRYGHRAEASDPHVTIPLYADGGSQEDFNIVIVMLDPNRSDASVAPTSLMYVEPTSHSTYGTLPAPSSPTAVFAGWFTQGGTAITSSSHLAALVDHTLFAHWEYTITATVRDITAGGIFIATPGNASINGGESAKTVSGNFPSGASVNLYATPLSAEYIFDHWELNGVTVSTSASFAVTVGYAAATYTAVFDYPPSPTTVITAIVKKVQDPVWGFEISPGTVWIDNDPYSYDRVSKSLYPGQSAVIHAQGDEEGYRYKFHHWELSDGTIFSTSADQTIVAGDSGQVYIAVFEKFYLVDTDIGSGSGTLTGAGQYLLGQTATLSASPASGFVFAYWQEDGASSSERIYSQTFSYVVTSSKRWWAYFGYSVNAKVSGGVGGKVSDGDQEGLDITTVVLPYNRCTLRAIPDAGYEFVNWTDVEGTVVSQSAQYTFNVDGNKVYLAHFVSIAPSEYQIITQVDPQGAGTTSGDGVYSENTSCTIIAVSNQGYTFSHWSDSAGSIVSLLSQYTFTVTKDETYTAHFDEESESSSSSDSSSSDDSSSSEEWEDGPLVYDPVTGLLRYDPVTEKLRYLRRRKT